jgi:hypothetical protein
MIEDSPWYVPNMVIPKDFQIPSVKEEIRRYSSQYNARLSIHPNDIIVKQKKFCKSCLLPSNVICIISCLVVVAQKRVYMSQYILYVNPLLLEIHDHFQMFCCAQWV